MLYIGTSSSESDIDSSNVSGDGSSNSSDGGEFRPPAGSMRTLKKTQKMLLRSSPRKNAQIRPNQQRTSPRKLANNGHGDGLLMRTRRGASSNSQVSPPSTLWPRQSARKRCPGDIPAAVFKIEVDPHNKITTSPLRAANEQQRKKMKKNSMSPKLVKQSPPSTPELTKNSTKTLRGKRGRRSGLVRQNAIKRTDKGGTGGRKRGRRPAAERKMDNKMVKDEMESSEEEDEDDEEEDEDEIDDFDLFKMVAEFTSSDDEEGEGGESSEEEKIWYNGARFSRAKVEQPKKRGRKPAAALANGFMKHGEAKQQQKFNVGRKLVQRTTPPTTCRQYGSTLRPQFNDYSNPFEAEVINGEVQQIDLYQRKMRDLVDLYRYLGQPDRRGLCRRPVHRPFLFRNLFYMRRQRPLPSNKKKSLMGGFMGLKRQHNDFAGSRTGSRSSNKMPATIKFALIRNNNCFGNKSAIVQCFHATEINGKLSQLKRIPSATFEKAVNEKISTCIDIDMLEECQAGVLEKRNWNRAEYFVVRIIFRLEDAEIGGRHLRKVPSRQSGEDNKSLRKNGPTETKEVVMFGSVRIFSQTAEHGLRALAGETYILLHTAAELHVDDLNTKSSVGQLARLINAPNKTIGDVPFIRIIVLNEDDDEEEDEEEDEGEEEMDKELGEQLAMERMMEELGEMEEEGNSNNAARAGEGIGAGRNIRIVNSSNGGGGKQLTRLLEPLPELIAIKFMLQPPNSRTAAANIASFFLPFQANAQSGSSAEHQPEVKRAKIQQNLSDSSADERMAEQSVDEDEELAMKAQFELLGGFQPELEFDAKREFALRVVSPSTCFLCKTRLKLSNLWALLKHLRFVHPRLEFTYDPKIPTNDKAILPGFKVALNTRFDASFEIKSARSTNGGGASSAGHFGLSSFPENGNNISRKRMVQSRPTWLVTKFLAQKVRANDDFPIERFTALSHGHWGEYEYLLTMGRFDFDTPTRIDQKWLIQTGSRKLEDITDLHPAERAMMQMWNAFLPQIRLTMIGHKMTYQAARVFVRHHWRQIDQLKLRTHFLLLLSTLLNANAVDEDERYDLLMRLDPGYNPQEDSAHFVTRELAQLEKERQKGGGGGGNSSGQEGAGGRSPDHQKGGGGGQNKNNGDNNMQRQKDSPLRKHVAIQKCRFANLADLNARYPFANTKRMAQIWKFLRAYDFHNFAY